MRRKLLSFIIIISAVVSAVAVHHMITRMDGGGAAFASLSPLADTRLQERKIMATEISLHPDKMLTIRGQDVQAILREPELVRAESPMTIWQYRTASCVLDVYFSGTADPLLLPVTHYEIRPRNKGVEESEAQADCVRDLERKSSRPHMIDVSALYKGN